jgi:1-acyl-sn-glycerol-3-phosphate acyltransferase
MTWSVPVVGDQVPQRGNALSRALGRWTLRLIGWTIEGEIPNIPKFMIIVAPHTSNWDFPVGVAAKFALGIRATFLGKHTLFRWPLGVVMRWLGGVPVFRHAPRNVVEQTVDHLNHAKRVVIVLSPEGTRRKLPAWRTGFHYVARGANLPILPAALDFSTKTVRFYPLYHPTDSVETNLTELGRHFAASMAYHPEQY